MPAEPSDESLMLNYRDGDLAAFRELYRRHSQGLYRFIAWRSPRRDWVDEIAQDSWAGLHQARARYQPESLFRTYLFQIARNRLIDLLRQQQTLLASEMGQGDDEQAAFDYLAETAQEILSPETVLENRERIARLHAAIRLLPGEQKEVLILQQFNGMSLAEIALIVAAPEETIKSRLRYAMRKLRQQLTPDLDSSKEAA